MTIFLSFQPTTKPWMRHSTATLFNFCRTYKLENGEEKKRRSWNKHKYAGIIAGSMAKYFACVCVRVQSHTSRTFKRSRFTVECDDQIWRDFEACKYMRSQAVVIVSSCKDAALLIDKEMFFFLSPQVGRLRFTKIQTPSSYATELIWRLWGSML